MTALARALTLKFCSERYKAPENRRKKMRAELNAEAGKQGPKCRWPSKAGRADGPERPSWQARPDVASKAVSSPTLGDFDIAREGTPPSGCNRAQMYAAFKDFRRLR